MKRATRNPEKTRKEIIKKSAPVFNKFGYAGTKMQMIIDATGYQMGGVYRHFNTKDDLAKAVFQYNYNTLKNSYIKGINDSQTPKEQLLTLMQNFRKTITSPTIKGGCPILNTATEVDDTDETFREQALAALEDLLSFQINILTAGIKCGDFKTNIHPQKEAQYIMATTQGAIMMGKLKKDIQILHEIYERLFRYVEEEIFS